MQLPDLNNSVSRIYDRNPDEFTSAMTLTVNLTVKGFGNGGSEKEVRIFSLRGAHLIAMFARTALAKAFRKWVLDILDAVTTPASKTTADARTPINVG
jgi:prophage antirepressor-like protein